MKWRCVRDTLSQKWSNPKNNNTNPWDRMRWISDLRDFMWYRESFFLRFKNKKFTDKIIDDYNNDLCFDFCDHLWLTKQFDTKWNASNFNDHCHKTTKNKFNKFLYSIAKCFRLWLKNIKFVYDKRKTDCDRNRKEITNLISLTLCSEIEFICTNLPSFECLLAPR